MFLGLFAAFVPFICTDYKEIREKDEKLQHLAQSIKDNKLKYDNAYDNSLLTNAIEKALVASDNAKNDAGKSKKKIEHFLLEIAQADRLNPVNLKLDDRKYDNLYEIKGTLSITDAPVFAWKNPEYNWFLVSNYTSVLLKRLGNSTLKQIRLVSRKNNSFKSFIKEGSQILEDIKQGSFTFDNNVRFYLLTQKEIEGNRAMIGQMVAGHDLFGIHLFIVNKDILNCAKMEAQYIGLKNNSIITNDVIDMMIYKDKNDHMYVKYPDKAGELEETRYDSVKLDVHPFIQKMASIVLDEPVTYLFYPKISEPALFPLNNKKTHISIS